jgi:hypothetical protein
MAFFGPFVDVEVVVDGDGDDIYRHGLVSIATMRSRSSLLALGIFKVGKDVQRVDDRGVHHGRASCDGIVSSAIGLRCPPRRFRDVQWNG